MLSLHYEYRVVPAPRRAQRDVTAKTTEARFAASLSKLMNDMGREGWEYQRADALPVDETVGLTGSKTTYQNMLIFRRVLVAQTASSEPMNEDLTLDDGFRLPRPKISLPRLGKIEKPLPSPKILEN